MHKRTINPFVVIFILTSLGLLLALIFSLNRGSHHRGISEYYFQASKEEKEQPEKLKSYTDKVDGYTLLVPSRLDVTRIANGVSIGVKDGSGITIEIYSKSQYSSGEAWLKQINTNLKASQYVIDGEILIDEKKGISAHEVSGFEEYMSPKILLFDTEDKVFVIRSPQEHVETILNSFKLN